MRDKLFCILFYVLVFGITSANAQDISINTDRPDQSDGVATVPRNAFQVENGVTIGKNTLINNFMIRYGITQTTEVRLLVDAGKESGIIGLKPLMVSVKQRLVQQHKIFPAISVVGYLSHEKLAGKDFQSNDLEYELKLAFEHELSDCFSLGYNIGGSNHFKNMNVSVGLVYAPWDKVSTFAEYFSTFTHQQPMHNVDVGILFLVHPKLQFDIACGRSIFDSNSRFFTTVGVSYLFN